MEMISIISEDAHGPPSRFCFFTNRVSRNTMAAISELMCDRVSDCCFYLASAVSLLQTHCVLS